eukprot:Em0001g3605a
MLKSIVSKFLTAEFAAQLKTCTELSKVDLRDRSHHKQVDLGFSAEMYLQSAEFRKMKISDKDVLGIRISAKAALITFTEKVLEKSPMCYPLARSISCLDSHFIARHLTLLTRMLKSLVDAKRLQGSVCDEILQQFEHFMRSVQVVKVANKELVSAAGIGEVQISVRNHCGKLHDITLKDVLFIPNASVNLLSTEKLTRDRQFGLLWLVPEIFHSFNAMSTDKTVSVDMQLLHERLGHLNRQDLLKLPNCTLGITMTDSKLSFCDSCAVSKSKRQPVNWKARERHTKPGQLIHTDINGPMEVTSLKGMRYIVCFIDDATRYGVIYLMKAKSEVLDCFKQYIDYMRVRQVTIGTGSTLQSDNQNGVAERFWNTIVDAARTMLHSAKLPKSYWGLAVKHATMLRNVSPSSALSGTTPFECVYGYKPNLATLRKFGSRAYVNTPKKVQDD